MVYRKNFRPMPEPQFPQGPEGPSTATTLHFGELKIDRMFETKRTFDLFKINKQALIGGVLKASTSPEVPVTEQNLRDALEKGKRFRNLFPPDEGQETCVFCFKEKQPVVTSYFYFDKNSQEEKEGNGGNFRGMSEKKILDLPETLLKKNPDMTPGAAKEIGQKILALATKLTAKAFDGKIPKDLLSRAVFVCQDCKGSENAAEARAAKKENRRPYYQRDFNRAQAREKLLEISRNIQGFISGKEAEERQEMLSEALGRRSRGAPQTEGGQRGDSRGNSPKEDRVEYPEGSGAFWFKSTGNKIKEAVENGDLDPDDPLGAIRDLSPREIFERGFVEFEGQATFVQSIAFFAKERLEKVATRSRLAGTGTVTLEVAAKHHEHQESDHNRGKKFRKPPRTNPKYDYDR